MGHAAGPAGLASTNTTHEAGRNRRRPLPPVCGAWAALASRRGVAWPNRGWRLGKRKGSAAAASA